MKCTYRGIEYDITVPTLEVMSSEVIGKYRGASCKRQRFALDLHLPIHHLKYRGVDYTTGISTATPSPVLAESGAVERPIATATPASALWRRTQQRMSELDQVHNAFLHKSLKERLAIAKAQGNQALVQLLEVEARDLRLSV